MVTFDKNLNQTPKRIDEQNGNSIKLNSIKNDFYETDEHVSCAVYLNNLDSSKCSVQFNPTSFSIKFRTSDETFLRTHGDDTSSVETHFEWEAELFDCISHAESAFKITPKKLELKLKKEQKRRWNTLLKHSITPKKPKTENTGVISLEKMNLRTETIEIVTPKKVAPPPEPIRYLGSTGLFNFGNSCYMNACLQCIAHTQDLNTFFTGGLLNGEGKLANAFASFLRDLWSGKHKYLVPSKIREIIGAKYNQFADNMQQDAQEFMHIMLNQLHDEINRVKKRPIYEPLENDEWPDARIAHETWHRFVTRDDSVVVDTFYGMLKSKLTCLVCGKASVTFDAFDSLLVPLPAAKMRIELVCIFSEARKEPVRLQARISKNAHVNELLEQLRTTLPELKNSEFKLFKVVNSKIAGLVNVADSIESLSKFDFDKNTIIVNEVLKHKKSNVELIVNQMCKERPDMPIRCTCCSKEGEKNSLKRCAKCFKAAYCNQECQKKDWFDGHKVQCIPLEAKPFALPFIATFDKAKLDEKNLKEHILGLCRQSVELHFESEGQEPELQVEIEFNNKRLKNFAELCECLKMTPSGALTLTWIKDSSLKYDFGEKKRKDFDIKVAQSCNDASTENSLDECLKLFTEPERLSVDNPWRCPRCKKEQEATKQINLWKLPNYLIVILKRFQASSGDEPSSKLPEYMQRFSFYFQNRVSYKKLNTRIEYPLHSLDMSKYVIGENQAEQSVYDLYGVINHLGEAPYLGHYNAFANSEPHNMHSKWRSFDDLDVNDLMPSQVVTPYAYVLFYKRRDDTEAKTPLETVRDHDREESSSGNSSPSVSSDSNHNENIDDNDSASSSSLSIHEHESRHAEYDEEELLISKDSSNYTDLNQMD